MAVASPDAESATADVQKRSLLTQLVRFIAIGGICAVIDFGTYSLLLGVAGWPVWLSKSISFILGTTASYFINRKFTFDGANTGNTRAKAVGFAIIYTTTFFVNVGTNQLLVLLLDAHQPWHFTAIWVIAQGLGTVINFVMLKWVVFRD